MINRNQGKMLIWGHNRPVLLVAHYTIFKYEPKYAWPQTFFNITIPSLHSYCVIWSTNLMLVMKISQQCKQESERKIKLLQYYKLVFLYFQFGLGCVGVWSVCWHTCEPIHSTSSHRIFGYSVRIHIRKYKLCSIFTIQDWEVSSSTQSTNIILTSHNWKWFGLWQASTQATQITHFRILRHYMKTNNYQQVSEYLLKKVSSCSFNVYASDCCTQLLPLDSESMVLFKPL